MDDYGLYARNRKRIRWIGSKLESVVFNRYTFVLFFLALSLVPIGNIAVLVVAGLVFADTVHSYREEHLDYTTPYRAELWSSVRNDNNQLAYLYLVMSLSAFGINAYFAVPPSGIDGLALIHAIILLLYAGAYVANAIGIHEYRYKMTQK